MKIHEFNSLYSDAHSPLSIIFKTNNNDNNYENKDEHISRKQGEKIKLWDSDKSNLFSNSLNMELVSDVDQKLLHLLNGDTITQPDIDEIVGEIGAIFEENAKNSFGYLRPTNNKKIKVLKTMV